MCLRTEKHLYLAEDAEIYVISEKNKQLGKYMKKATEDH